MSKPTTVVFKYKSEHEELTLKRRFNTEGIRISELADVFVDLMRGLGFEEATIVEVLAEKIQELEEV